jgi:hypothetical protein
MAAVAAFELGNVAATLLILRATQLLTPAHGSDAATSIALGLYAATTPRPPSSPSRPAAPPIVWDPAGL